MNDVVQNIIHFFVTFLFSLLFLMGAATILVYLERKVMAWMQDRYGPLHVGPHGALQTVMDVAKLLLKEDLKVSSADNPVYKFAPMVFFAPVITAFVVIPFSPYMTAGALSTGLIYYVALSSIDVIGVFMAGWGSNNKYALIGGLRSTAQMISYELPLILSLVGVIMLTSVLAPGCTGPNPDLATCGVGSISFTQIVAAQMRPDAPWLWFFLLQPLGLVVYYICGLAETNRSPFDLPEAVSELVAGYLTEYSGLRWAMFFLGEYGNMVIVSAIATSLFLGGWSGPGVAYLTALNNPWWGLLGNLLALGYFLAKVYGMCTVFIWVRTTLPRLRSDQLMQFAWLILMPVTLGNIILTGIIYFVTQAFGAPVWLFLVVLGVINWLALVGFIWVVGRATVASTRHAQAPAIRARRRAALPARPALPLRDGVPQVAQLPQAQPGQR